MSSSVRQRPACMGTGVIAAYVPSGTLYTDRPNLERLGNISGPNSEGAGAVWTPTKRQPRPRERCAASRSAAASSMALARVLRKRLLQARSWSHLWVPHFLRGERPRCRDWRAALARLHRGAGVWPAGHHGHPGCGAPHPDGATGSGSMPTADGLKFRWRPNVRVPFAAIAAEFALRSDLSGKTRFAPGLIRRHYCVESE
jgi:hypothetical protein